MGALLRAALAGFGLSVLFGSGAAAAQGTRIHMHGDGPYAADGFLFAPATPGSVAGLLLIPGAAGITPAVQASAVALAAAGYQVVVLDPNRGGPPDPAPSEEQVWADVGAALQFLGSRPEALPGRIGVLGVARGACAALRLGREQRVQAVAVELVEAPAAADVPRRVPLLMSVARADPHRKAARSAASSVQMQFYATADKPGSGDGNELFAAADVLRARQQEIEFFAQLSSR